METSVDVILSFHRKMIPIHPYSLAFQLNQLLSIGEISSRHCPQSLHTAHKEMAEEDICVTSFKLWLLHFFILSGLLVFFIWLAIHPKSPSYTVTNFSVQNGSIGFEIEIENPNKDSQIYFANINFTCYNYQEILGYWLIPSFSQDKGEKTPQSGVINLDDKVWKALEVQIAKKNAQLQVTLVTKIRYRTWGIKSPRQKVYRKGQLPIGPDGKIPGKAKLNNRSKMFRIKKT